MDLAAVATRLICWVPCGIEGNRIRSVLSTTRLSAVTVVGFWHDWSVDVRSDLDVAM